MNKKLIIAGVAVAALGIVASSALYTVNETEQALILQFGQPTSTVTEPGLKAKLPWQNVVYLERRVLDLEAPTEQVILADQRRLEVDAFVRYRIQDPLRFYQTVNSEAIAETRLASVTNATLRRVLGSATQLQVLSDERAGLMEDIARQVNQEAQRFGIQIVDVRIRRTDVPEATTQNIFARMRSEREREAAEARAQGAELAQQIRSRADRERTVILAEAQRDAQTLRGEGDNQALRILADANSRDAEFYHFYRTLQAYRESLRNEDTTLVLSPQGEFFRFFGAPNGPGSGDPRPASAPGPRPSAPPAGTAQLAPGAPAPATN
jgi:membrane protease subunit HflC